VTETTSNSGSTGDHIVALQDRHPGHVHLLRGDTTGSGRSRHVWLQRRRRCVFRTHLEVQTSIAQDWSMPSTDNVRPSPRNTATHNVRSRTSSSANAARRVVGGEAIGILDRKPLPLRVSGIRREIGDVVVQLRCDRRALPADRPLRSTTTSACEPSRLLRTSAWSPLH
jgi:hypothetical protein